MPATAFTDTGDPERDAIRDAILLSHLPSSARLVLATLLGASHPSATTGLHAGGRVTITQICQWTGLARSTATELVCALDRAGWIDRSTTSGGVRCGRWSLRVGQPTCPRRADLPGGMRLDVLDRDGHACRDCGTPIDLTVDHIIPWALGGSDDMTNLQTLCRPCNSSKGARV